MDPTIINQCMFDRGIDPISKDVLELIRIYEPVMKAHAGTSRLADFERISGKIL